MLFLKKAVGKISQKFKPLSGATEQLEQRPFVVLPGCDYARCLMPLDYPPSRAYKPRYGATHPPLQALVSLFEKHDEDYRKFLEEIRSDGAYLKRIPLNFRHEDLPLPGWLGVPMCCFDAAALYTMMRTLRPKRYLEIGSGISTCFANQARKDHALPTKITSIDPDPRAFVDSICDGIVRDGLETCDLSIFDSLEPNDIVFLDGSHRTFMNSDVTVFMIEVLPRLKPGVVVHVHDIMLPYDYAESFSNWYWNEQYMLAVYMIASAHRIRPLLPTCYISRSPRFGAMLDGPLVDLGTPQDSWHGGGSMWFTHTH